MKIGGKLNQRVPLYEATTDQISSSVLAPLIDLIKMLKGREVNSHLVALKTNCELGSRELRRRWARVGQDRQKTKDGFKLHSIQLQRVAASEGTLCFGTALDARSITLSTGSLLSPATRGLFSVTSIQAKNVWNYIAKKSTTTDSVCLIRFK